MSHPERILVPVDMEPDSRRALEYAFSLADRVGAKIDIVHVWEPPKLLRPDLMVYLESNGRAVSLVEFTQNQARAELSKLLEEVAPNRPGTQAFVVLGDAARQIVETAEAGSYDMIVMGTRGRRGLPRHLLGSVAEKVVRLASCPVIVVPPVHPPDQESES